MKARLQRAQAQGIDESDLPPVPRSVISAPAAPRDPRQGPAPSQGGQVPPAAGDPDRPGRKGPPGRAGHPSPGRAARPRRQPRPGGPAGQETDPVRRQGGPQDHPQGKGMRFAVLASGGDPPGMDAAIRAVVRQADALAIEVHGVWRGLRGWWTRNGGRSPPAAAPASSSGGHHPEHRPVPGLPPALGAGPGGQGPARRRGGRPGHRRRQRQLRRPRHKVLGSRPTSALPGEP
jgi:hypothetical protein